MNFFTSSAARQDNVLAPKPPRLFHNLFFCYLKRTGLVVLIMVTATLQLFSAALNKNRRSSFSPDKTIAIVITGRVTDSKDQPLQGVSIKLKGASLGTTTDASGRYSITIPDGNGILVFSFIGFTSQEVAVNGRNSIDVKMVEESTSLSEVVVTALGIAKEVKSLTYETQNIKGDQLNQAKEVNIVNSLQGKVAGVTITRDATGPGGGGRVLIRGNRSITNSNEPLYVIDGVPLSGNVGMLNSDDVESMTILKGASAAALYGSQGQNGAIIITTKRGHGETTVNYTGGLTFDQAAILPELQYEYGQGDAGVFSPKSENSWGPKATGQPVTLWNGNTVPLTGQPDRLKNFFRTAQTLTNSLSIQGGTVGTQTYFSYGNTAAQGILPNNELNRHNIDLKIDKAIGKKLSFATKLTYINETLNNRVESHVLPSIYNAPVTIPASEMQQYSYIDPTGTEKQSYWKVGSSVIENPYFALNRNLSFQKQDRALGLVSAKYQITDWLDVQVRGSLDKNIQNSNQKIYADNYYSQVGSNYSQNESNNQAVNADALVSFKHTLNKLFDLSGNVGASLQESKRSSSNSSAGGLYKSNFFFMGNAKAPTVSNSYGRSPRVQSLYGTTTLAYRNYLYLDMTARNDWSSALPKASQSYFYPSGGLSAIVSDMVKLPSWVSYGKLRVSLASSGYGGREYLDRKYYSVGTGGAISTPTIQSLGDYKPEITTSFETGLDWQFFSRRLGFNVTYYDTKTKNQLLTIGVPPASLYNSKYINAGLIQNKGVELVSNFTPLKARNFTWDATVNYSKNINKVIRLTENINSVVIGSGDAVYLIVVNEGSAYGDMYVKGWQKDSQGRHLVDNTGTPILTDGLNVKVGNYNPDYMLGFSNSITYKNVSLSFLIDHRQGGIIFGGTQALIDAYGDSKESLRGREGGIVLDAYKADGTKNTAAISSQKYFSLIGGRYPTAEFYSYPGTSTRLRELVFSYTFSNDLLSQIGFVKRAEISLVGRNLFFFQRTAPVDAEVTRGAGGGGLEYGALPPTRNFGLNLKLSF